MDLFGLFLLLNQLSNLQPQTETSTILASSSVASLALNSRTKLTSPSLCMTINHIAIAHVVGPTCLTLRGKTSYSPVDKWFSDSIDTKSSIYQVLLKLAYSPLYCYTDSPHLSVYPAIASCCSIIRGNKVWLANNLFKVNLGVPILDQMNQGIQRLFIFYTLETDVKYQVCYNLPYYKGRAV